MTQCSSSLDTLVAGCLRVNLLTRLRESTQPCGSQAIRLEVILEDLRPRPSTISVRVKMTTTTLQSKVDTARKRPREEDVDWLPRLRPLPQRSVLPKGVEEHYAELDRQWRLEHRVPEYIRPPRTAQNCTVAILRQRVIDVATQEERQRCSTLTTDFANRHSIWHHSNGHNDTQVRLLPLLALAPVKRVDLFTNLATTHAWDPNVALSYYEALLSAARALEIIPSQLDHRFIKVLQEKKRTTPPKPPNIISPPQAAALIHRLEAKQQSEAALAVEVTYTAVQRLPDVLSIETAAVTQMNTYTSALVTKGKVTARAGAHPIHLQNEPLGDRVMTLLQQRENAGATTLFPEATRRQIRAAMPPDKQVQSLRKGAAIAASLGGTPIDTLSRAMGHASIERTTDYLRRGVYDTQRAAAAAAIANSIGLQAIIIRDLQPRR